MTVRLLPLFCLSAVFSACSPNTTPRQRYLDAINKKLAGDSGAAYDILIALAHEEPNSRAGRRARAILTGGSVLTDVAILATVASLVLPHLEGFTSESQSASVRAALSDLAKAQHAFFATHKRFCVTFEECGWQTPRRSTYLFYLSRDEVTGGTGVEDKSLLRIQTDATLATLNLVPKVTRTSFLVMALGDPDVDDELDVWSMDEEGNLVNLIRD